MQGLTDTEADLSSMGSRPASRQVSCDISRDTAELPDFKPSSSFKSKMKSHDSGIFEKVKPSILLPACSERRRSEPTADPEIIWVAGVEQLEVDQTSDLHHQLMLHLRVASSYLNVPPAVLETNP